MNLYLMQQSKTMNDYITNSKAIISYCADF